jgi:TPR repeat protein
MRDKYRAAVPVAGQVRQIRTTLVPVIFSVAVLAFVSFAAAEEGDMTAPAEPPAVTSAESKPGAADDLFRKGLAAKDRDDYREATRWWREAAELGEIRAMLQLAWVYSRGASGISRDHPESAKWYRKAAERGNPAAQHSLGVLYRDGQGVPRDYEQAMLWFQRAAKQGNTSGTERYRLALQKRLGCSTRLRRSDGVVSQGSRARQPVGAEPHRLALLLWPRC